MKKILLALGLSLLLHWAKAQPTIHKGIFFGSISSRFSGDDTRDYTPLRFTFGHAYHGGLILDLEIKPDIFLSWTPSYKLIKGSIWSPTTVATSNKDFVRTMDLKLHYLSMPLELKIISDNSKWQFFTGLVYDHLVKGTGRLPGDQSYDLSKVIESSNLSATIGLGYRIKIKRQVFTIDLRYSQGILNISNGNKDISDQNVPRIKTFSTDTRVSWILPHKKKEQ